MNQILHWVGLPVRARWRYRDYALCPAKAVCFATSLQAFTPSQFINTQKLNLAFIPPSWPHAWLITNICFWACNNWQISLRYRFLWFMKSTKLSVKVLPYMFLLTNGSQMSWKSSGCLLSFCADSKSTCKNTACLTNHPVHQATRESRCSLHELVHCERTPWRLSRLHPVRHPSQ